MYKPKVSAETKEQIIEGLFHGRSLSELCNQFEINRGDLWREMQHDPLFKQNIAEARESRCHDLADSLVSLADEARTMVDVQRLRLKSENIRFVISKLAPKTFGDNLQVNVNATLDLSRVLTAAAARIATPIQHQETNVIDVSPLKTEELTTGYKPVAKDIDDLL